MTSKKLLSCILVASLLTGTIPVGMSAVADETPSVVTITPGTDEAKTGTGQLTITLKIKQSITPTVSIADWQYKGTPSTPVVEGNTGSGEVTYLYKAKGADDSTYSETVPTAVGQYTVKASIAETADYKAGEATADFEIKPYTTGLTITLKIKQSITPTVSLTGWTYGGTANTPSVTGNDGKGAVTYHYKLKTADDTAYSATVPTAAGEYTVKAVIAETDEYKAGEATTDFTIAKAPASPEAVTGLTAAYGKTLADVRLPDGWAWDDALTTSVGDVGNNTFAATFTPTDTANYNNYSANLTVAVTAISATPTAVGTLNATYGDTLADVDLPTPDDGTWAWKDAATTSVGNAGEQTFKAVFTPSSPNYTAVEQDVTINVAKADPVPKPIDVITVTYGSTLADVTIPPDENGTWAWQDDTLSVGNVGKKTFGATYTPADTNNYKVIEGGVQINVVAVDKTALNEAVTAANTYLATIQKTVYAGPALALSSAITDANAVAENDNVTEAQVAQAITDVNNAVTTAKAAVKDIDDTKAAQAVTDKINALPAVENIKSTDKEAIEAARAAYAKLTEAQSAKVTKATTDKLTAAEKAVADRIAADAVIEKINAIGEVVLTNESKALIDAARTAYEALATDAQKALVSNYTTLTAGEKKYSDLQIENAKTKIDVIGDIEFTDESKASIENAKAAYNALTADQKALVANAKVLDYAEKLYDSLEAQVAAETAKAEAETDAATAKAAQTKAEADAATAKAAQTKAEADAATAKAAQTKAEADAATAKAAQTKAEADAATAKAAQTKAEAEAATAKAAQTKAEEDTTTAKAAQAKAEEEATKAKAAQTKAEEDTATAKAAQATAEKNAEAAKAAQTKAETEAAAAKTAQAKAEEEATKAKAAQAKAETDAATAKTAQAKAEEDATTAKAAQAKAEADATTAKAAQTKAEEEATTAKAAQTKAEADAATAKAAQAKAEADATTAKAAQTKAEEEATTAKAAQTKAEADAATAKAAQTKAEEDAAIAKAAQTKAEEEATTAKAAQTKAEADAATAKAAQNKAEADAATAKAAQNKAEEDAAIAKAAQTKAEADAATAKTAQTKAEADAATAKTAQANAEKAAANANTKVSDLTEQLAATEKQLEELESSSNVDEVLKKQVAELKEQLDVAKSNQNAAKEALAKAQDEVAAKITAAEAAQAIAEKTAEEATEKAAAAEKAQTTAEQTAKEAIEKAAAAEKAQTTAEQNAKEATEKAAAAERAQTTAEQTAKEATEKAAAAERAQTTAEQTAKEATEKAAAAEKAQATAEKTAKEATEKAAAAEEAQAVANQAAADTAIEKINAIGSVNKTNYCENKIVRARAIYDSLTDEQKALVPADIVAKLTAAETEYDTLPQTGMSGLHKLLAGLAALMGITGIGLIKKSRKEDDDE